MRLDFWHKWVLDDGNLMLALIGSVMFGMGIVIGSTVIASLTASVWFEAHVEVPDHRIGQDPMVEYERVIRRNMNGQWTVEVQRHVDGEWVEVCQGDGIAAYGVDEKQTLQMSLSRYAGVDVAECLDRPGSYRVVTAWWMLDGEGSAPNGFWDESNVFEVME